MISFGFTQRNYPQLVINDNGDSLVLQTLEQSRWVSKQIEIGKACILSGVQKDSIITHQKLNEITLLNVIKIKDETILSKDSTITDNGVIINSYKVINKDLEKQNKKLQNKNTGILIGSGILVILISILAFL